MSPPGRLEGESLPLGGIARSAKDDAPAGAQREAAPVGRLAAALGSIPDPLRIGLAALLAAVLAWRAVVAGIDAQQRRDDATVAAAIRHPGEGPGAERRLRERLAQNPADAYAMLALALALEQRNKPDEADAAMTQALLLAPVDLRTLLPAAEYYLRSGREAEALAAMRRAVDSSPTEVPRPVWEVLVAALGSGRHHPFFLGIARDNPPWWQAFFRQACSSGANTAVLESLFGMRASAGIATAEERECMVSRLQRARQWTRAYDLWVSGLPPEQQREIGYVFNGGFELPLSKQGFDWLVPPQPGVVVSAEPKEGRTGSRALQVAFANTRFAGPPVFQYLLLYPGRYQFDGRARADLKTWLGLQWSLYCEDRDRVVRRLFRTEPLAALSDWRPLRGEFVVPPDCPVQVLRLELANPGGDARPLDPGPVRLDGRLWFDDFRVRFLDAPQPG